jgi:hypothetical protein
MSLRTQEKIAATKLKPSLDLETLGAKTPFDPKIPYRTEIDPFKWRSSCALAKLLENPN